VNVEDGKAEATSEVAGEGNISASASASSGPGGSRGRSSTAVNGETETLEKDKKKGEETKTKRSSSTSEDKDDEKSGSKKGSKSSKEEDEDSSSKREVNVEDGKAESTAEARGSGTVEAEASASSSPSGSRGRASTTVDGQTETFEARRGNASPDELPVCLGLAKFDCCDDRNFKTFNGQSYCGCWGTGQSKDRCNFERTSTSPIVVRDIFANLIGYSCRCPDNDEVKEEEEEVKNVKLHFEEEIEKCTGYTEYMCCDHHDGSNGCRCWSDTECLYKRVSSNPTIWGHRWAKYKKCRCS